MLKSNSSSMLISRIFSFRSSVSLIVVNTKTLNNQFKDFSFFLEHLKIMCLMSLQLKQQSLCCCFSQSWNSSMRILFCEWEKSCSSAFYLSSVTEKKMSVFKKCQLSEIHYLFNNFWSLNCWLVVLLSFLFYQILLIFFMHCLIVVIS